MVDILVVSLKAVWLTLVEFLKDSLVDILVDSLVDFLVDFFIDSLVDFLVDFLIDSLVDFLVDFLIDSLVDFSRRSTYSVLIRSERPKSRVLEQCNMSLWEHKSLFHKFFLRQTFR